MACPYHARHLEQSAAGYFGEPMPAERAQGRPDRHGVMTKCTFCKERVDDGLGRGLVPGVDADATPMCAVACITGAIVFGDLDDPASTVSRLARSDRAQVLQAECGTEPRVYYLAS
jgi:phenylacetyl-CoA:acceptor oxidoreductase subunit 1